MHFVSLYIIIFIVYTYIINRWGTKWFRGDRLRESGINLFCERVSIINIAVKVMSDYEFFGLNVRPRNNLYVPNSLFTFHLLTISDTIRGLWYFHILYTCRFVFCEFTHFINLSKVTTFIYLSVILWILFKLHVLYNAMYNRVCHLLCLAAYTQGDKRQPGSFAKILKKFYKRPIGFCNHYKSYTLTTTLTIYCLLFSTIVFLAVVDIV